MCSKGKGKKLVDQLLSKDGNMLTGNKGNTELFSSSLVFSNKKNMFLSR